MSRVTRCLVGDCSRGLSRLASSKSRTDSAAALSAVSVTLGFGSDMSFGWPLRRTVCMRRVRALTGSASCLEIGPVRGSGGSQGSECAVGARNAGG